MSEVMTLGPVVTDWIERHCVIPDGEQMGQPFRLTQEMKDFVDAFYAVDLDSEVRVRSRRPVDPAAEVGEGAVQCGADLC
jgi:hypothetical protein